MEAVVLSAAITNFLSNVTATIRATEGVENKWKDLGESCKAVFVTVQEFNKYETQIREAVKAGLKASDQKVLNADLKDMSEDEKKDRKKAGGKVSKYFLRIRDEYAFPPAPVAPVADPVRTAHEEAAKKAAQASIDKAAAVAAENAAKMEKKQLEESLKLTELLLKSAVERKDKAEATKTRKRVSDLKRKVQATESKVAEATTKTQEMIEAAKAAQLEANAKLALIEEQKARESLKSKLVDALKVARDSKLPNAPDLVKALQAAHDLLVGAAK